MAHLCTKKHTTAIGIEKKKKSFLNMQDVKNTSNTDLQFVELLRVLCEVASYHAVATHQK